MASEGGSTEHAWVVAIDMGYGHQRAAYPFRDIAYEGIITANIGATVEPAERRRWMALQSMYEGISRISNVPLIGPWLWRTRSATPVSSVIVSRGYF
jgi:hypothetical protein